MAAIIWRTCNGSIQVTVPDGATISVSFRSKGNFTIDGNTPSNKSGKHFYRVFSNLAPGTYIFQVQALTSEPVTYKLDVK